MVTKDDLDIKIKKEPKVDKSFQESRFIIVDYLTPITLDCNRHGGEIQINKTSISKNSRELLSTLNSH